MALDLISRKNSRLPESERPIDRKRKQLNGMINEREVDVYVASISPLLRVGGSDQDIQAIICMYISCVGLCVHVFMNPMPS